MGVPYLTYFNLKEEPFNTTANPRFFYQSPIHSMALGKTEFTVDAKKGLTIVFGDTGYGKSTLARLYMENFSIRGIFLFSSPIQTTRLQTAFYGQLSRNFNFRKRRKLSRRT